MKTILQRLRDKLWPWSELKRLQERIESKSTANRKAYDLIETLIKEIEILTQQRDTAVKSFEETKALNHRNAAVEKLTQVQLHKLNVALNDAGLSHLFPIHPSLAASHGLAGTYQPKPAERTSP